MPQYAYTCKDCQSEEVKDMKIAAYKQFTPAPCEKCGGKLIRNYAGIFTQVNGVWRKGGYNSSGGSNEL